LHNRTFRDPVSQSTPGKLIELIFIWLINKCMNVSVEWFLIENFMALAVTHVDFLASFFGADSWLWHFRISACVCIVVTARANKKKEEDREKSGSKQREYRGWRAVCANKFTTSCSTRSSLLQLWSSPSVLSGHFFSELMHVCCYQRTGDLRTKVPLKTEIQTYSRHRFLEIFPECLTLVFKNCEVFNWRTNHILIFYIEYTGSILNWFYWFTFYWFYVEISPKIT